MSFRFKTLQTVNVFSDGSICFSKNPFLSKNSFILFLKTEFQNESVLKTNKKITTKNEGLKFTYRNKMLVN